MSPRPRVAITRAHARLEPGPRLVVVGVGGAGVATLVWLAEAGGVEARMVAVDACPISLASLPDDGGPAWRPEQPVHIRLPRARRTGTPEPVARDGAASHGAASVGAASDDADAVSEPAATVCPATQAVADAAQSVAPVLHAAMAHADIVFVVGSLSGATGGGATPVVAELARSTGALVIGFGLAPFPFEPVSRHRQAAEAEARLLAACDAVVTLDGALALGAVGADLPLEWAAAAAREVVRQAVMGVSAFVDRGGCLRVGRADLGRLLGGGGRACVSVGAADIAQTATSGKTGGPTADDWRGALGPAERAVTAALESPFADLAALGCAERVLCQITGGPDLTLADVDAAIERLGGALLPTCELQIGVLTDALLPGTARATLIGAAVRRAVDANMLRFPTATVTARLGAGAQGGSAGDAKDVERDERADAGVGTVWERPVRSGGAWGMAAVG